LPSALVSREVEQKMCVARGVKNHCAVNRRPQKGWGGSNALPACGEGWGGGAMLNLYA
jgi:hypothetical protein